MLAKRFECIWRVTEPNGTRIRVEVMELTGNSVNLKIGNGIEPTHGVPVLVIDTRSRIVSLPTEMLSIDSGLWITLKYTRTYGYLRKLRLVFTTYHETGKMNPRPQGFRATGRFKYPKICKIGDSLVPLLRIARAAMGITELHPIILFS